jgi:hypothetical protein
MLSKPIVSFRLEISIGTNNDAATRCRDADAYHQLVSVEPHAGNTEGSDIV